MDKITEQDIARGTFEATYHMTGHQKWHKAHIIKVTSKFVDAAMPGMGHYRYRRDSGEERGDYCGFKSTLRPVRQETAMHEHARDPESPRPLTSGTRLRAETPPSAPSPRAPPPSRLSEADMHDHDEPTEHTCPYGSRPVDERCDDCWHEENDDLDFAMLTPPTRPGPCKAATAPEMDSVEKRLERERALSISCLRTWLRTESALHAPRASALAPAATAMCSAASREPQVDCCGDCGSETGYPGRCDSCDWKAKNVKGEFVIALNGKNVGHSDGTVYVFETVYEAERMASICYPGVVGVRVVQKGAV